jgi:hypothetical protein
MLAVARGGYISGRSVRFQIASDRRTVRVFEARIKCARRVVVHELRLRGGRRFGYRGQVGRADGKPLMLRISGRLLSRRRVTGLVRARSPRSPKCDSGKIRFVARLT